MAPFQWVLAQLHGTWMTAWFQGQDPLTGLFRVQFSDDAPTRLVSQIRPR